MAIDLTIQVIKTDIDLSITTDENTVAFTVTKYENANKFVRSNVVGEPTGSLQIVNAIALTKAEYLAGTPKPDTWYLITDEVNAGVEYQRFEQWILVDGADIVNWQGNYALSGSDVEWNLSLNVDYTTGDLTTIADNALRYIRPSFNARANQTLEKVRFYTGNNRTIVRVAVFKALYTALGHQVIDTVTVLLNEIISADGWYEWDVNDFLSTAIAKDEFVYIVFGVNDVGNNANAFYSIESKID